MHWQMVSNSSENDEVFVAMMINGGREYVGMNICEVVARDLILEKTGVVPWTCNSREKKCFTQRTRLQPRISIPQSHGNVQSRSQSSLVLINDGVRAYRTNLWSPHGSLTEISACTRMTPVSSQLQLDKQHQSQVLGWSCFPFF